MAYCDLHFSDALCRKLSTEEQLCRTSEDNLEKINGKMKQRQKLETRFLKQIQARIAAEENGRNVSD